MVKSWESHERLPAATTRELFTRYLDITSPPSVALLKYLATTCTDDKDKDALTELAQVS